MSTLKSIGRLRATALAAIAFVAAMTAGVSCSSSGCSDNRSSIPLAGFYSYGSHKAITLDSLEIFGIGAPGDSMLLTSGKSATQVYLPLRANRDDVTFEIKYTEKVLAQYGVFDRISIGYTTIPYFASEECGAMYRYRITSIDHTRNILDSVAVTAPDSVITNVDIESMQLYFRVSEE